jgi:hypothetical protein
MRRIKESLRQDNQLPVTNTRLPECETTIARRSVLNLVKYAANTIYPSMALQPFVGSWPLFQFLNLLYSR